MPLFALFLLAAEEIVLHTGFRLAVDRHEIIGDSLRLHTASGTMEIPRASVASIEAIETVEVVKALPAPLPPAPLPAPKAKTAKEHLRDAAG